MDRVNAVLTMGSNWGRTLALLDKGRDFRRFLVVGDRPATMWLRSWRWDGGLLAFGWVPFYLWLVFGLGFGREAYFGAPLAGEELRAAFRSAILLALGATYVHRHYTLLLVYGDQATFRERARAYVLAPVVIVAFLLLARSEVGERSVSLGAISLSLSGLVIVVGMLWNIWHTIAQRYGILRVYAGRAGGALATRAQARRDRWLLWSMVLVVALLLPKYRADTFLVHVASARVLTVVAPFLAHPAYEWVLVGTVFSTLVLWTSWLRCEFTDEKPVSARVPRLLFVGANILLFAVFLLHGPIVGYLCSGVAHVVEYLAFVHFFAQRRSAARGHGFAYLLWRRPALSAPLLLVAFGGVYFLLQEVSSTKGYLLYYTATSWLHFLYDGWIWKVRKPQVAKNLGFARRLAAS